MKSLFVKALITVLILSMTVSLLTACAGIGNLEDPTTEALTTEVPTTEAPTTEVATEAPTTEAATTEAPTTEAASTEATTTEATTTEAPTTEAETEPEISFPGAASPKLAEIAKKMITAEEYVIFTIGDSVTQGQQASDPYTTDYTGRFAVKLAEIFSDKTVFRYDGIPNTDWNGLTFARRGTRIQSGTNGRINIARCGLGGDTVEKTLRRTDDFINKEINKRTGDLFTICLGINDSWPGGPTPDEYKASLGRLVDAIQAAHPEADIILMTPTYITDNSSNPLVRYANAMKALADERGLAYIDLNAMFNENYAKSEPEDWLADNCHPNDAGYNAIANEMIQCLFGIEVE